MLFYTFVFFIDILKCCICDGNITDPLIVAWKQTNGTGYNKINADVQKVQYSASYVYICSASIPSYTIGPWTMNPSTPTDQKHTFKFPRTPTVAGTKTKAPLGHIGVWTNGVSIYNADDAQTYNNAGIWKRNAYFFEKGGFDSCNGHPSPFGEYHHHVNPVCVYSQNASTVHSSIVGFAFDGYPVYGIFAYSDPLNNGSTIKRMRSSYQTRSITVRHTLSDGTVLSASQYGPDVSTTYPLGAFLDDYTYTAGSGDLDEYNGRFAKTPEYPSGTYAYFVTTDTNGDPEYPYTFGPYYYGTPVNDDLGPGSGKVSVTESFTIFFTNSATISEIHFKIFTFMFVFFTL